MSGHRHKGALPAAVVEIARRRGVVTRLELADELNVTPATITNVVKRLLRDGLLEEAGRRESTGGKPAGLLRVNAASRCALGIEVGFTSLTAVATDLNGEMRGQTALPLGPGEPRDAAAVTAAIRHFLDAIGVATSQIVGVGVAAPPEGVSRGADWARGVLVSRLESEVRRPVVAMDEATCAAVGEYWTGGAGQSRFATVYMSHLVTASFMEQGRSFGSPARGSIGHVSVDPGGVRCPCGSRGCLDLIASPDAVVRDVMHQPPLRRSLGIEGTADSVTRDFARICRAAVTGDARAAALIERAAEALGWVIVDLAAMLGLDAVFLAGPGFTYAGALYERTVQDLAAAVVGPLSAAPPLRVTLSGLGMDAAALGAASLATKATLREVAAQAS